MVGTKHLEWFIRWSFIKTMSWPRYITLWNTKSLFPIPQINLTGTLPRHIQVSIDGRSQKTYDPAVMVELLTDQLRLNLVTWSDMSLALGSIRMSFAGVEVEFKELVKPNKTFGINSVIGLYTRMLEEYAMRKVRPCLDERNMHECFYYAPSWVMNHGALPGTTHGPCVDCHRRGQRIDGLGYSRRERQKGPSQLLCSSAWVVGSQDACNTYCFV